VQLILLHPEVAFRDCEHCLVYSYDEETGELEYGRELGPDGERLPLKRLPVLPAPCRRVDRHGKPVEPGCPKGTPENPVALSPQNEAAWQYWRECRAVGRFPEDAWVRKNATIIQDVIDGVKELRDRQLRETLNTLAALAVRPIGV
jgi:hypothetical protein